jgi:hypothetical protein
VNPELARPQLRRLAARSRAAGVEIRVVQHSVRDDVLSNPLTKHLTRSITKVTPDNAAVEIERVLREIAMPPR